MSPPIEPGTIKELTTSPRWSALARVDEPLSSITRWDRALMRHPRMLVPIDVQALYVPAGSTETFVRLPFATTTPDGTDPEPMPAPFDSGTKRPMGVHLHWAMPDTLLNGALTDRDPGAENRLALPPLPDRWVLLRLLIPRNADRATVTGWVIEADTTKVTALTDWPQPETARAATGKTIAASGLTGTVGGTLNWSGCYDAVANRFSFHDPLADLPVEGVLGDFASYLVCGWWAVANLDPLDVATTNAGLQAKLGELKWRLTDDLEDRGASVAKSEAKLKKQNTLTLSYQPRYQGFEFTPKNTVVEVESGAAAGIGGLFTETASRFGDAIAREPYASLLHGVVHGVPVAGAVVADQRPLKSELTVA